MKSLTSFGKISLWQKFLLLGVLWIIMVSIPTLYYGNEIRSQIAVSRLEQQGLAPAQLMLDIIQRTQQHRALTARFLQEDPAVKNSELKKQRRAKAEDLEEAIVDLEDYSRKIKNSAIEKSLDDITADWHQISQHVTVRDISLEQNFQLHEQLIDKQLTALKVMVDNYQLSRDSEPGNYSLIASSLSALPQLIEVLAKIQVSGTTLLTQGEANFSERVELKSLFLLGNAKLMDVNFGINKATASNVVGKENIQQRYLQVQNQYQQLISVTQEEILSKASFVYSVEEFTNLFSKNIDGYYDFVRFSMTQIDVALKNRIEQKDRIIDRFYTLIFFLTALVLLISGYCVKKLLQPLRD